MGYDLHITRAPCWVDSDDHPIGREEWTGFAHNHPALWVGGEDYTETGTEPIFGCTCRDGTEVSLLWQDGRITITGATERAIGSLVPIAAALDARLVGDEDEVYGQRGGFASLLDRLLGRD